MPIKYLEVRQSDDSSDASPVRPAAVRRSSLWPAVPWLLHAIVLTSYTVLIFAVLPSQKGGGSPCFSEKLLNAPIVWEDRTYLTNIHTGLFDPYSSANPKVDEAWNALIDTHVTTITEEEKANLPGHRSTAPAYGGESGYAVLIEVFHQLHCLNAIRKGYYSGNNSEIDRGFADPGGHSDHCFSYLLQTLLCHADVGVMTTTWNERAHVFMADFNVTKQCRNYDAIKTWAQTRKAKFSPPPRG